MRKVHTRAKRHQSLRTHLCGAKILKERKRKQVQKMLSKKKAKKNNEKKESQ